MLSPDRAGDLMPEASLVSLRQVQEARPTNVINALENASVKIP